MIMLLCVCWMFKCLGNWLLSLPYKLGNNNIYNVYSSFLLPPRDQKNKTVNAGLKNNYWGKMILLALSPSGDSMLFPHSAAVGVISTPKYTFQPTEASAAKLFLHARSKWLCIRFQYIVFACILIFLILEYLTIGIFVFWTSCYLKKQPNVIHKFANVQ